MKEYIQRPVVHRAMQWNGTPEETQEIISYVQAHKNATAVPRLGIAPGSRMIRIYFGGRVLDLRQGYYLVHDIVKDELFVLPADFFQEHFHLRPQSKAAVDRAAGF